MTARRTGGRRGAAWPAALLVAAGGLGTGCIDTGRPLVIIQNQVTIVNEAGGCLVPSARTDDRRTLGIYDVALDHDYPYYMYPLVHNGLPTAATTTGLDPNRVEVTRWRSRIEAPAGVEVAWPASCPREFDYPSAVGLNPGDEIGAMVEAMRPCHSAVLRGLFQGTLSSSASERVIFRVVLRAKGRHGGTEISSDPFEFPVQVCYGCLQTGYGNPEYADFAFPAVPACTRLRANTYLGNRCNPAQDFGPLLCCARDAEAKQLECPGVPRATM